MVGDGGLAFLCWKMEHYRCTKDPFRVCSESTDIHEMMHQCNLLSQHYLRVTGLEPCRKFCVQRANNTMNF